MVRVVGFSIHWFCFLSRGLVAVQRLAAETLLEAVPKPILIRGWGILPQFPGVDCGWKPQPRSIETGSNLPWS